MFGITNRVVTRTREEVKELYNTLYHTDVNPPILEGGSDLDTLCPVSKYTGHRTNPLDCLGMVLDPAKERLLGKVLKELSPVMQPNCEGNFDLVVERLNTGGTLAEREILANQLGDVYDSLRQVLPVEEKQPEIIPFERSDEDVIDNV